MKSWFHSSGDMYRVARGLSVSREWLHSTESPSCRPTNSVPMVYY